MTSVAVIEGPPIIVDVTTDPAASVDVIATGTPTVEIFAGIPGPPGTDAVLPPESDANNNTDYGIGAAAAGSSAVALGYLAKVANNSVALGANAEARAAQSVAIGKGAIATLDNQIMLGTATEMVHFPNRVSGGSDTGLNTVFGTGAMPSLAGSSVTAIGRLALSGCTAGNGTAVGNQALSAVTNSYECTAVGNQAGYGCTGSSLTIIGHGAGFWPNNLGASSFAVLIGAFATAYATGQGANSVGIGYDCRVNNYATAIGFGAQARGAYSVAIGFCAIATLNNQIMLGTATETVYTPGKLQLATSVAARAPLNIPPAGGVQPTTRLEGDIWVTTVGMYAWMNGVQQTIKQWTP